MHSIPKRKVKNNKCSTQTKIKKSTSVIIKSSTSIPTKSLHSHRLQSHSQQSIHTSSLSFSSQQHPKSTSTQSQPTSNQPHHFSPHPKPHQSTSHHTKHSPSTSSSSQSTSSHQSRTNSKLTPNPQSSQPPPSHQDQSNEPLPPKPSSIFRNKEAFSIELRRLQTNWMKKRVKRPFWTGMTSNGINYIDTRPSDDNNNGTILDECHYSPSDDNPDKTPLKKHTIIPETPFPLPLTNQSSLNAEDLSNSTLNNQHHPQSTTTSKNSTSTTPTTNQQPPGITILLAHGFSFGYGMWSENFDTLSQLPGVNRVVAFDWRGMGGSLRHLDNGPIRSSVSVLEQYKHDTFISSPKEIHIQKDNKKTSHLKRIKCKQHFKQWFQHKEHDHNQSRENNKNNDNDMNKNDNNMNNINSSQQPQIDPKLPKYKQKLNKIIKDYVYESDQSHTPQNSIDYFVDPLLELFTTLKLTNQPVIIVAHSLGGYLSANFIHKYPTLVQSLVLASPVGVCESYGLKHEFEFDKFQQYAVSGIKLQEHLQEYGKLIKEQQNQLNGQQKENDEKDMNNDVVNDININDEQSGHKLTNTINLNLLTTKHASFFPLPTLPYKNNDTTNSTTTPTPTSSTSTSSTNLNVSTTRLTKPLILRNPIIQLINFLWQTNSTPQSLLRALPNRASHAVSSSLASRMHPPGTLSPTDEKIFINYLHHIFTAPPTGEHALNSILHIDYPSFRAKDEWKLYKKMISEQIFAQNEQFNSKTNNLLFDGDLFSTFDSSEESESDMDIEYYKDQANEQRISKSTSKSTKSKLETNNDNNLTPEQLQEKQRRKLLKSYIHPSVFARKPLTDILYDVNIPIHFLFGSHDWLFHRDVPYIIGSLHQHFQHPQTMEFLHDKALHTAFSPIQNNNTTTEDTKLHQQDNIQHGFNNIQVTTNNRNEIIDQLNLHPAVTLTILPQSGHHLYVNNMDAFHLSVHNSIIDFAQQSHLPHHTKYSNNMNTTTNPNETVHTNINYRTKALEKYVYEYNQHVQIENEKKLKRKLAQCNGFNKTRLQQSLETFQQHIKYLFGPKELTTSTSTSTLSMSSTTLSESIIDPSLQSSPHVQPSQILTSKCPVQRLHRFNTTICTKNKNQNNNISISNLTPNEELTNIHLQEQLRISPLEHAATSSLLSQETTIPNGNLKSNVCKYARFILRSKNYQYTGVNNSHFDRFHNIAKSIITKSTNGNAVATSTTTTTQSKHIHTTNIHPEQNIINDQRQLKM